mmetsp:Transcript_11122/g.30723  ORF Transcript_11122/g.30723 Transcript_11122/m.30723 type:complete len:826 (-) Transcript_11122:101-2578(-)
MAWNERGPRARRGLRSMEESNDDDDDDVFAKSQDDAREAPQLLARQGYDRAASLVQELDASDILECYLLTRQTYLHHSFGSSSKKPPSSNNSTDTKASGSRPLKIPVRTAALGLRYRPPAAIKASNGPGKRPLSLTLEFGPSRAGKSNLELSVPVEITSPDEEDESKLSWDNEGQVYFTTDISPEDYRSANYVASLTGAVLHDLLKTASEYSRKRSHRRYQPWQVVQSTTDRVMFKSSSDYDFVHTLLAHLASVGVELEPVLLPFVYRLQLTATEITRHVYTGEGRAEVVEFYQKLYQCMDSLATGTVLTLPPSPQPTNQPTTSPAPTTTTTPTAAPTTSQAPSLKSDKTNGGDKPSKNGGSRRRNLDAVAENNTDIVDSDVDGLGNEVLDNQALSQPLDESSPDEGLQLGDDVKSYSSTNETDQSQSTEIPAIGTAGDQQLQQSTSPSAEPSGEIPSMSPTVSGTTEPPVSNAEAAANAAAAAQQAANIADETDNADEAAEAAKQAASAAQKAASVTVNQQASLRQESLLSGSADLMSQTSSLCLSDPVYGIADGTQNTTTVYLIWDSTFYYKVEVVAPYIRVLPIPASLPQPPPPPKAVGDLFVDWTIFFIIVTFFLFAVLLLLQQILGRNFRIIRPLYKCQRWFFDPRNHHYDDLQDTDEAKQLGGGHPHTFGQDGIPSSMGGVRSVLDSTIVRRDENGEPLSRASPTSSGRKSPRSSQDPLGNVDRQNDMGGLFTISDENLGDVELTTKSQPSTTNNRSWSGGPYKDSEEHDNVELEDMMSISSSVSGRLFRDPELVDLPHLKSHTKPAVPFALKRSNGSG